MLVLSLFPGIGLLDRGFEAEGFCVVRGPDLIYGGDVRNFSPPAGKFDGIIGGPPCQDFSSARRCEPTGEGLKMLKQFERCVVEASPEWWLCENVVAVPDVEIIGYESRQRFDIDAAWYSGQSRRRHIQFASKSGRLLHIERGTKTPDAEPCAMACDGRSFREICDLQGLPDDFDLPLDTWTEKGRKSAVGNGVPYLMARTLARAILDVYESAPNCTERESLSYDPSRAARRRCECGCGRIVGGLAGRQRLYDASCRKRVQRARDRQKGLGSDS